MGKGELYLMKEEKILDCLIKYSKLLNEKYNCNTGVQFIGSDKYKIKFFLMNKKVAFTYIVDLTNSCNIEEKFEEMIEYYKEKCTKWCGGIKNDIEKMEL